MLETTYMGGLSGQIWHRKVPLNKVELVFKIEEMIVRLR